MTSAALQRPWIEIDTNVVLYEEQNGSIKVCGISYSLQHGREVS